MRKLWMMHDYYGIYSRIEYGIKGDEVSIIGRSNEMVKVLNHRNKETFYINEKLLSDVPVQRSDVQPMSGKHKLSKSKKR